MRRHLILATTLVIALLSATGATARTWTIRADGSGDAPTIQAGIDSATTGDTVLITSGTYFENLTLGKALTLTSESGPEATIIDGSGVDRVLTIPQFTGGGPAVEGLTLRNGRAPSNGQTPNCGGGVWVGCSGTTVRGNIIERSVAGSTEAGLGGGIFVNNFISSCLFEQNVIQNNYAVSSGGGLRVVGSEVRRNIIRENSTHVSGGGAWVNLSTFADNLVVGNSSDHFAAALVVDHAEVQNNTIVSNRIFNTDQVALAVLVVAEGAVHNNIVVHNTGGSLGQSQAAGIQCYKPDEASTIYCNDVWGNDVDEIRCSVSPGNFSLDPLFCDAASGNFTISDNSPCAPPRAGPCGLVGALSPACHTTPVQEAPWSRVKSLYR